MVVFCFGTQVLQVIVKTVLSGLLNAPVELVADSIKRILTNCAIVSKPCVFLCLLLLFSMDSLLRLLEFLLVVV
jgi:hypothetical protein